MRHPTTPATQVGVSTAGVVRFYYFALAPASGVANSYVCIITCVYLSAQVWERDHILSGRINGGTPTVSNTPTPRPPRVCYIFYCLYQYFNHYSTNPQGGWGGGGSCCDPPPIISPRSTARGVELPTPRYYPFVRRDSKGSLQTAPSSLATWHYYSHRCHRIGGDRFGQAV